MCVEHIRRDPHAVDILSRKFTDKALQALDPSVPIFEAIYSRIRAAVFAVAAPRKPLPEYLGYSVRTLPDTCPNTDKLQNASGEGMGVVYQILA